jgi:NitT/TauT family transport system substrate-binding protein
MPDIQHKITPAVSRRGVLTGGALVLLAAGCASGQTATDAGVEKPVLVVGAIQSTTAAGLYLAAQHGFFSAVGLDVKIVPTSGSGPAMTDLLNGTIDVSFGNYVSFIAAQAKGIAQLRILAEGNNATAHEEEIVVPKGSPITSVAGLRGKTVAVNALAGVGTLLVSSVLAENAVPVSSVRFTAIPFPEMDAALTAHRIDAAWIVEPFLTQAEISAGVVAVADTDQGATQNFPVSGYVVTQAWVQRYPRTAAAFTAALNRGQVLADTSRTAVEQALPRYIKISRQAAALVVTGTYPGGLVDKVQMQRVADVMHQFGMLKQPFDVAPMIGYGDA